MTVTSGSQVLKARAHTHTHTRTKSLMMTEGVNYTEPKVKVLKIEYKEMPLFLD